MKVLVTGACGHIGSKLIRSLPESYELLIVDNMLTQRYPSLFYINRKVKFLEQDISDLTLDQLEGIDVVIHLAAITNAEHSFKNQEEVEDINLVKTKKFIDTCQKAKCKFIFPSSTSVYGVATDEVFEDNKQSLNPQSPYADSKIKIEEYLEQTDLNYIVLRFGTIFGESVGMRFHTAINKFCYQAALGIPLTIWKQNYEQYRPYLGLNDCVSSIVHFIDKEDFNWRQTYNILTGNYRLKDIVERINKIKPVEISMVNTPLLNQYSYMVNFDKALSTGFTPEDDLFDTVEHILELLGDLS